MISAVLFSGEFYADELSDTEDSAGVMVHSESTTTVVERPHVADDTGRSVCCDDTGRSVCWSAATRC